MVETPSGVLNNKKLYYEKLYYQISSIDSSCCWNSYCSGMQLKERALNKADAQMDFLQLEINTLIEAPLKGLATTQAMIDQQIEFKQKEIYTWQHIKQALLQY